MCAGGGKGKFSTGARPLLARLLALLLLTHHSHHNSFTPCWIPSFFTNSFHRSLLSSGMTPQTDTVYRYFWAYSFWLFLIFPTHLFFGSCGGLSWLKFSFWAYIKIASHIVSYICTSTFYHSSLSLLKSWRWNSEIDGGKSVWLADFNKLQQFTYILCKTALEKMDMYSEWWLEVEIIE